MRRGLRVLAGFVCVALFPIAAFAQASISGTVKAGGELVAEIELMFSHIDQNMAGLEFPEHNFVFTEQFTELLKGYRTNTNVTL